MSWSLGEVRALAIKAARGSGLHWGMAEEAGFACHWLENHGLPGTSLLSSLLKQHDATENEFSLVKQIAAQDMHALSATDQVIGSKPDNDSSAAMACSMTRMAGKRAICPLLIGTMISDGLLCRRCPEDLQLRVSQPGLLMPFLNQVNNMQESGAAIHLTINAADTTSHTLHLCLQSNSDGGLESGSQRSNSRPFSIYSNLARGQALSALASPDALCWWSIKSKAFDQPADSTLLGNSQPGNAEARVPDAAHDSIRKLTSYAARTYAPETDESREKGAGAGTTDND